jgi:DNA-binding transcriptional MerR regulator
MAQKTTEYVPVGPVAKLLHVSEKTVARWSTEGYTDADGEKHQIPSVRTLGGHRRYSVAVVNELAEFYGIAERL